MKFVSNTKFKILSAFLLVLIIVFLSFAVYITGSVTVMTGATGKKLPIYSVGRDDNKISISFDCAYGADYTDILLDVLDDYNVKCTFFAVEFWVNKFPDKAKEIVNRGHDLGTHSKTHPNMSKLSKSQIEEELTSSINKIESVTGQKVTLFRAPFGDYDNEVISVAENMGLYTIQWDVDSIDWKNVSAKQMTERIVSKTVSGSIILCHNNGLHTAEALPEILNQLQNKGYTFVKISELIYKENYTINSFGKQIPN